MRRIQAPGVETNEIDNSTYSDNSNSNLTDTAALILGFGDFGPDYTPMVITNMNRFTQLYGSPTNEAERYFYYGASEVINSRGQLVCAKLPYDNDVLDKYSYTTYVVSNNLTELSAPFDFINKDLINKNLSVEQIIPDNSFFDVLNMTKLGRSGFEYLANEYGANIPSYAYDLINYAFNASNISMQLWDTFNYYFLQSFVGIYNFIQFTKTFIQNNGIQKAFVSSVNAFFDEQFEKTDVDGYDQPIFKIWNKSDAEDLSEIYAIISNNYYKSLIEARKTNPTATIFDLISEEFARKHTLSDFKDYYTNLNSFIAPVFTDIINRNDTDFKIGQTNHYWKVDFANLSNYIDTDDSIFNYSYGDLNTIDETLTSFVEIKSVEAIGEDGHSNYSGLSYVDELDKLRTNSVKVKKNTIRIYDISRCHYAKNSDNNIECIGILPVVTTAANALYFQELKQTTSNAKVYNPLSKIQTVYNKSITQDLSDDKYYDKYDRNFLFDNVLSAAENKNGYADVAVSYFPQLEYTSSHHLDRNYLKQIGIVVFKMVKSPSTNRIQLIPVESFVGSLNKNASDLNSKTNNFIDNIVNDTSQYINVFSNVEFSQSESQRLPIDKASLFLIKNQTATSLGFYETQCKKTIGLTNSILKPLDRIFESLKNIDTVNIDIVVDGGVSTIAQYIASTKPQQIGEYNILDNTENNEHSFNILTKNTTRQWYNIIGKYDNFCKNVRKDCMFIADALRSTCLIANQQIIRDTAIQNTIENNIIANIREQINVNSSYGAGYCNWFYIYDGISKQYFWCPPSIKAAGAFIYTDIYFNYWDAPAGLNRGVIQNTYGLAFNPTNEEAGKIYKHSWNYAIQYPIEGTVLEGQRTFQIKQTAFDRINVRRMFLKMEKYVYRIAKRFCYEGNTPYLRQRFVDTITPIFDEAKAGGGISEYIIICNDMNNTTKTIENHELHCTIAVRPVKTIEFVVMNFIAMPQAGSFNEDQILSLTPYYG